jgi:hypothetical protein
MTKTLIQLKDQTVELVKEVLNEQNNVAVDDIQLCGLDEQFESITLQIYEVGHLAFWLNYRDSQWYITMHNNLDDSKTITTSHFDTPFEVLQYARDHEIFGLILPFEPNSLIFD